MLSIARSGFSNLAQVVFLAMNAIGLLFGAIYNSQTPDLYGNNAHHKIGWIATWIVCAQAIVGLVRAYGRQAEGRTSSPPSISKYQDAHLAEQYRYSRDSGQGTEPSSPRTSSPTSHSPSLQHDVEHETGFERFSPHHSESNDAEEEKHGLLGNNAVDRFLTHKLRNAIPSPVMRIMGIIHSIVDRTIMFLGFIALTTGIVTYGGHFVSDKTAPKVEMAILTATTRKQIRYSVASPTSSKVASSSGTGC